MALSEESIPRHEAQRRLLALKLPIDQVTCILDHPDQVLNPMKPALTVVADSEAVLAVVAAYKRHLKEKSAPYPVDASLTGAFPSGPPQVPIETTEWILDNPDKAKAEFRERAAKAQQFWKTPVDGSDPIAQAIAERLRRDTETEIDPATGNKKPIAASLLTLTREEAIAQLLAIGTAADRSVAEDRLLHARELLAAHEQIHGLIESAVAEDIILRAYVRWMDRTVGLYRKFDVRRTDGSSDPGRKHASCDYFVLDWNHDPFMPPAALAYATACEVTHPALAADLRARVKAVGLRSVVAAKVAELVDDVVGQALTVASGAQVLESLTPLEARVTAVCGDKLRTMAQFHGPDGAPDDDSDPEADRITDADLAEIDARTAGPGSLTDAGELLRRCAAEIRDLRAQVANARSSPAWIAIGEIEGVLELPNDSSLSAIVDGAKAAKAEVARLKAEVQRLNEEVIADRGMYEAQLADVRRRVNTPVCPSGCQHTAAEHAALSTPVANTVLSRIRALLKPLTNAQHDGMAHLSGLGNECRVCEAYEVLAELRGGQ